MDNDRRRFLALLAAAAANAPLRAAERHAATPPQTAGPFYPRELPLDADNDLIHVAGRETPAKGIHTNVYGRVLDPGGNPVPDASIEVWQCDANTRYHHPDDTNDAEPDANFQGYGSTTTDEQGRYRFLTIKPVAYPGRTPHIHFRITTSAGQLTTQLYVRGDPHNADDGLFRRLGERAERVLADFVASEDDSAQMMARFDIVMA